MKEIMERIQFYLDHRSYEQIKLGAVVLTMYMDIWENKRCR